METDSFKNTNNSLAKTKNSFTNTQTNSLQAKTASLKMTEMIEDVEPSLMMRETSHETHKSKVRQGQGEKKLLARRKCLSP